MKVTAVVVTYNRPEELKLVVAALLQQSRVPEQILVIDNASAVPAANTLAGFSGVDIFRTEQNYGGAGGFALGVKQALEASADWVWLLDDDAIPRQDALAGLLLSLPAILQQGGEIGAVCSAVYEFDKLAPMHRRKFSKLGAWEWAINPKCYTEAFIPIDTGSFVGFLLNARAAQQVGLPNADFFLAYDDTEYSLRLVKAGFSNWLVPVSGIDHFRTSASKLSSSLFCSKHYYNIRNRIVVAMEYAGWQVPGVFYAVLVGFAIWVVCGGLKQPSSFWLLKKAVTDGVAGRLGPVAENNK